ncbi:hybrid sensor histidine kinase/response regulator [Calycomorphotria hydatis]|uniref:Response regulator MprA n=1 Tax=Calycomorphotria hydatis TaxID=2528027 RepID=A0A517T6D6_9PLAN|nr:response regulator [Calycomorphotria hydatis]QDT63942.1 Response regulator MprA [Calycomorphotria hydatis]
MTDYPRVLVFGHADSVTSELLATLDSRAELVRPHSFEEGLKLLREDRFQGVFLTGQDISDPGCLLHAGGMLQQLPDGFVLLDQDLTILWANPQFARMTGAKDDLSNKSFYAAFGSPEILGPDFCPFHTALATNEPAKSTLRVGEKQYYEVHARPILDVDGVPGHLAAVVHDVSDELLQRQKLNAIHQAGFDLGDLAPADLKDMSVEDRIELLKSRIMHYTQDLLEFETTEIRLLEKKTRRLDTLLSSGMRPEAERRTLFAEPTKNGVTGFVAATGKSYLCEDTRNDPLYLPGAEGARSSLTVPLMWHEEILGVFNVESPYPNAFDENDLQFLELFAREVAVALNTLELLVAEKATTASESTELIMREVAGPVDDILNDTAWVLERYIGHEPVVCERLTRVLKHTRDIKQLIQQVGQTMRPKVSASDEEGEDADRTKLKDKRILVVDSDTSVRQAAHTLLGRFGCDVETAHDGDEALLMARSFHYDAVIVDIRLPDMTGYDCFIQLREISKHLQVILMTGFGYDPDHCIVKARQAGLRAVLYKPFRLDQLIEEVEKAVSPVTESATSSTQD